MNLNLLIEKNIQLRHTYLKATAFSIAFGKSRSTRIFLLTVLVTVRDSYSFVWVTLGVFLIYHKSLTLHFWAHKLDYFSANFSRGPKWTSWWKSKDPSWRNVKNIMEFFTRGFLTKPSQTCYIYSYTYCRMIKFCYHLPPMKSWLTSTDLGSRGFFAKSVGSKSFLRKAYLKNTSPEPIFYDDLL